LLNANTKGDPNVVVAYGLKGDIPLAGDWNGDGTTTIGTFRPSNSTFYFRNSNAPGNADITISFGIKDDFPVVGDWDDK
jgi:hypothetical protein